MIKKVNATGYRIKKANKILIKEIEEYVHVVNSENATMNYIISTWHAVVIPEQERFKRETLARAKALGLHVSFGT